LFLLVRRGRCGGELVDECVAFGVQGVASSDVGPFFGLGEFVLEVMEASPVRVERLPIE
jgi:hypothetical protein